MQDECRTSRNWTYSAGRVAAFVVTDLGLAIDAGTGGGQAVAGFCWLAAARRDRRSDQPAALYAAKAMCTRDCRCFGRDDDRGVGPSDGDALET